MRIKHSLIKNILFFSEYCLATTKFFLKKYSYIFFWLKFLKTIVSLIIIIEYKILFGISFTKANKEYHEKNELIDYKGM